MSYTPYLDDVSAQSWNEENIYESRERSEYTLFKKQRLWVEDPMDTAKWKVKLGHDQNQQHEMSIALSIRNCITQWCNTSSNLLLLLTTILISWSF